MGRRSLDPPLYWRSLGADSPLDLSRGLPPGHASPPGAQNTGGKRLLPADWPDQSTALQYRRPFGPWRVQGARCRSASSGSMAGSSRAPSRLRAPG